MADQKVVKKFTLAEIAKHNTREDVWLVIHGKVYDVTKFLEEHPGGDDTLLDNAGKEASDEFEDIGHSSTAREQLADFYIGDVEEPATAVASKAPVQEAKTVTSTQQQQSSWVGWKLLQVGLPLVLFGIAYYVKVSTQPLEAGSE